MRFALLGDIHANLPALEVVLESLHSAGVDAIWNTGDLVGYHAFPDEVVSRLRSEQAISVIGNYDQKVLRFPQKEPRWRHSKRREKFIAFQWAFNNLSKKNRTYLRQLPTELRWDLAGFRLLMTHGSPASISEHIDPGTPQARLSALAQDAAADVIILGHSHIPMDRLVGATRFVNPGSVGRADDGDPRAAYAILEITNGQVGVHHFRIRYDIQRACRAIRENDLPKQFEQMAIQGRSLDFVLNQTG